MSKSDQGMSVPISLRIKSRVLTSVICFSCLLAPSLTVSHQSSPCSFCLCYYISNTSTPFPVRALGICRFQCLEHSFPDTCIDDLSPFTFLVNCPFSLRPSLTTSYKIVSPFPLHQVSDENLMGQASNALISSHWRIFTERNKNRPTWAQKANAGNRLHMQQVKIPPS